MTGDSAEKQKKEIVLRDYLGHEERFDDLGGAIAYVRSQIDLWEKTEESLFEFKIRAASELTGNKYLFRFGAAAMDDGLPIQKIIQLIEQNYNRIRGESGGQADISGLNNEQIEKYTDIDRKELEDLLKITSLLVVDFYQPYSKECRSVMKTGYPRHVNAADVASGLIVFLQSHRALVAQEGGWADQIPMSRMAAEDYFSKIRDYWLTLESDNRERLDSEMVSLKESLKKRNEELKSTLSELLRLGSPKDRWKEASEDYEKSSKRHTRLLSFILVLGVVVYFALIHLLLLDESDVFTFQSLRVVSLIFLLSAAYFYAVRILARLVFSSLHLARDAREREHLTHVYLALISEGAAVGDNSRDIVLQALFSRSNTGLLGDDSSPTMPSVSLGDASRLAGAAIRAKG